MSRTVLKAPLKSMANKPTSFWTAAVAGNGTFHAQDLSFPRMNSTYGELAFPFLGPFVPGERNVPGTKVLHRDLSFLETKGLGYEKSVILVVHPNTW